MEPAVVHDVYTSDRSTGLLRLKLLSVENKLQYRFDISIGEDASRLRKGNLAQASIATHTSRRKNSEAASLVNAFACLAPRFELRLLMARSRIHTVGGILNLSLGHPMMSFERDSTERAVPPPRFRNPNTFEQLFCSIEREWIYR